MGYKILAYLYVIGLYGNETAETEINQIKTDKTMVLVVRVNNVDEWHNQISQEAGAQPDILQTRQFAETLKYHPNPTLKINFLSSLQSSNNN